MECSTRRMECVAKLLAEEIAEKMVGKQDVNEMEGMMRELVKGAANMGVRQALEQGEETYGNTNIVCACGRQAQFVSKHSGVLWTVFGKVNYKRRYYLCGACHQGQSPLDQKYGIVPGQTTPTLTSLLGVLGVEVSLAGASHWQFTTYKFTLQQFLPFDMDKPMGQVRQLDKRMNDAGLLRLMVSDLSFGR